MTNFQTNTKVPYHFDMETADPDDAMTLAILATHERVNLVSVSIHPGGHDQIGLVRHILNLLDRTDVKIGAGNPKSIASRVSGFHKNWVGNYTDSEADDTAAAIMAETLSKFPDCSLLTGAALTNVHALQETTDIFFSRWFCQGGFAGDNIVPKEHRLEKFDGMITCPTFNLNGNPIAAEKLLSLPMQERRLISKNVCHGAIFTKANAELLIPYRQHNKGLDLFLQAVSIKEKALHDTVAALLSIDPSLALWKEVIPYRTKGQWGCREANEHAAGEATSLITTYIPDLAALWMVMKPGE
ncbi:MAG: inosine-uridine preferring nucleoside hydrolase superfamily [Bacteroidetes bacterium]|jgi:pyrimidine-specific ribonucleoside hydrolase|nr:inosine-uridine preferring nucleoside hydrolase superfamily [Bacteroidota bacterium]